MHGLDLCRVPPSLLALAIPLLRSVDLSYTYITPEAITNLIISLTNPNHSLEDLTLLGNNLSSLPADLLATLAGCKLRRLDLSCTQLQKEQLRELVDNLGPPLREISLFGLDLGMLDEGALEKAKQRVYINYRRA